MPKESYYFPHDYNARNDLKLVKLAAEYEMEGIGIYWCLVEMLYEEEGYIMLSDCDSIAIALRVDCERIMKILKSCLFDSDGEKFWSNSVLRRLEIRHDKSLKASESASKRWGMQTHSDDNANALLEKKGKKKENKVLLPEWIDKGIWTAFAEMRKEKRAPLSDRAIELTVKKLEDLRKAGDNPNDVLNQSIMNNYTGVFPVKRQDRQEPVSTSKRYEVVN